MSEPLSDLKVIRLWHELSAIYQGESLAIVFAIELEKLHGIRP